MESKFLKDIISATTVDLQREADQYESLEAIRPDDVERVLRHGLNNIIEELVRGNKVYLINAFNLEPKDYKEKNTVNPQTKEPMVIPPYRSISIKPSDSAKARLKEGLRKYPI